MSVIHHSSGSQLIVGLLIFSVMTLIVGELGEHIANGAALTQTDLNFSAWLETNRSPGMVSALRIATELGSTWWAICSATAFGIYLILRRRFYWLAAVWLSVFGGMLLNLQLKTVFQRARPSINSPILLLTGYSFPSGHTMAATVLYTVVAVYFVTHLRRGSARALVVLVAVILIAMVGFSRIYLGAHYLTDVLGAMAEGLAWATLCLVTLLSDWRQHDRRLRAAAGRLRKRG